MPIIRIEVNKTGVTKAQKQEIIKGVTQLLVDVLQKDPALTHVIFQEIDNDNWGYNGLQVSDILRPEES